MTEKIMELVYDEINGTRVMSKLKLSGINNDTTVEAEKKKNAAMRAYHNYYETCVKGFAWFATEYEGKELRKELHKWAKILHKDGLHKIWSARNFRTINDAQEGYVMLHFSKSIIEAFKKLPRQA